MKKLLLFICLLVFSFAINANAKEPKEKISYPKAVLTLNDGTVLNGFLRNNLHFDGSFVMFSDTEDGKKVKYKNETIKSLCVKDYLGEGKDANFIPLILYWREGKRFFKTPSLAIQIYQGKHVKGYMSPSSFDHTSTNRSFTGVITSNTNIEADLWDFIFYVDSDSTRYCPYWTYRPEPVNPKFARYMKYTMRNMKKDFKAYPQVLEEIEKQGLTAEQINKAPIILLEILDKSLQ